MSMACSRTDAKGVVHKKLRQPKYGPGKTKQAFKDECDINRILQRAQKTGTVSHLAKHQAVYGDFANFDFERNLNAITRGREIFDDLPSELRKEFHQNPGEFFRYVNDPANADRLPELLPQLAQPGRQYLDVSGRTPPDAPTAPQARQTQATEAEPAPADETSAEGS